MTDLGVWRASRRLPRRDDYPLESGDAVPRLFTVHVQRHANGDTSAHVASVFNEDMRHRLAHHNQRALRRMRWTSGRIQAKNDHHEQLLDHRRNLVLVIDAVVQDRVLI